MEEYQSALLKHQAQNRALYTDSEPATGSVLLSSRALQRARLGGVAVYNEVTFPGHAVSWEGAQGNLSAAILKSTPEHLRFIAFNSSKSLLDVNMRVWGLENGTYEVVEGTDVSGDDQDDQIDIETTRRQLTLRRYSEIPFSLRPQKRTVIDLKQIKKSVPILTLPDLAIGSADVEYNPATDQGVLTIHNLGSTNAPGFSVVVENERRTVILKKDFPGLEAPLDLLPKTVKMEFSGLRGKGNRLLTFRVDPTNQVDELNEENNQVRKVLN
ncbi:MAG: CARDB domain-containing protein [Terriglobia bacterium]